MTDTARSDPRPAVPSARLTWMAAAAGIVLWSVHLAGMAALPSWACPVGAVWPFHALTVGTLVPTAAAVPVCRRVWRAGDEEVGGLAFVGGVGAVLNAIFVVAIVAEWVPVLVLDGCLS